jgi:hypothetical protein
MIRQRNNKLSESVLEVWILKSGFRKDRTMNKLAFAALGLLTRAGRSLAALAGQEKANPATNRKSKKSKVAHKLARAMGGSAKAHSKLH